MYAYAAICSLTLAELFPDPEDSEYNKYCVRLICKHLNMNERAEPVMLFLSEGNSQQTQDAYIAMLLEEPCLKGKVILVVQDLVLMAVQNGKYRIVFLSYSFISIAHVFLQT